MSKTTKSQDVKKAQFKRQVKTLDLVSLMSKLPCKIIFDKKNNMSLTTGLTLGMQGQFNIKK